MSDKKHIVVSGFWGRGNTGDEAMLQRIYDFLSPSWPVALSLDRHGAYDGFWNWYPYNQSQLVHQMDVGAVEPSRAAALHIGGGGLGFSFNGSQLIHSVLFEVPVLVSGIDFPTLLGDAHLRLRTAADFFTQHLKFVSFRTRWSYERYLMLSNRAHLGADWAWDLPVGDVADGVEIDGNTIAMVVREENAPELSEDFGGIELLTRSLEALGYRCIFIPFSPEDVREMRKYASESRCKDIFECWWNPQAVKAIFEKCRMVVSFGRYHPLIFGASMGVPTIYVETRRLPWQLKVTTLCHDLDLPMTSLSSALENPEILLSEADRCANVDRRFYGERLEDMKFQYNNILRSIG